MLVALIGAPHLQITPYTGVSYQLPQAPGHDFHETSLSPSYRLSSRYFPYSPDKPSKLPRFECGLVQGSLVFRASWLNVMHTTMRVLQSRPRCLRILRQCQNCRREILMQHETIQNRFSLRAPVHIASNCDTLVDQSRKHYSVDINSNMEN
jgi:hypothetical protein